MMDKLSVVKIGGNIIDDKNLLSSFLRDFAALNQPKILVHGGGNLVSKLSERLDIPVKMNNGRRVTSKESLEVATMVFAGSINKNISAQLQKFNCNAIGLSGSDGNAIKAVKRPTEPYDFGFVGDIEKVNSELIKLLLQNGITPVFCAISHDGNGQLLNTNADTIAAEIAIAMSKLYISELTYCFEKQGVLSDINNPQSVIESINETSYEKLKLDGAIHEGMLPKLQNCLRAAKKGVSKVKIGDVSLVKEMPSSYTTIIAENES